jgi:hypothetical protein
MQTVYNTTRTVCMQFEPAASSAASSAACASSLEKPQQAAAAQQSLTANQLATWSSSIKVSTTLTTVEE